MSNLIYSILPNPPRAIVYVHPDVNVAQCLEMMVHDNIGALVVMDDNNLLGIVSERDIVRGLLHHGPGLLERKVTDILWADVAVLKPSDTIETAMAVIIETKRRHVLVADAGNLTAIVSIGDLLFNLLENKARVIQQLENYIQH